MTEKRNPKPGGWYIGWFFMGIGLLFYGLGVWAHSVGMDMGLSTGLGGIFFCGLGATLLVVTNVATGLEQRLNKRISELEKEIEALRTSQGGQGPREGSV